MPAPVTITHAEIKVYGQFASGGSNSKNTLTTFNYRRTSTTNPFSKVNLDAIFQSTVMAKVLLASNVRWNQLYNTIRGLDDAQDAEVPFTHNNLGAGAGDGMDTLCSVYMNLRTGFRGPNYRGAKHFPGLNEADTTQPNDDILNAGALTAWGLVVTAMGTPLVDASSNTWKLEVVARTIAGSQLRVNPTTVIANDVTTILLNKRIGRMKRRQPVSVY